MSGILFSSLNLSPEVLKAVDKLGFEQATPIQGATIPTLMSGRDVVGQSQTGSGKTAAFAIPAIEKIDLNVRQPQVLILCPTRELAVQVAEEIHSLTAFRRSINVLPIYGGQAYDRQLYGLRQGAHILIATPGRLMDHMRRGSVNLTGIKMVILDEADVMLNMGFREDIELILKGLPTERQSVFFSATMPRPIQELIQTFAKNPEWIRTEQKTLTVPTVDQSYYEVDRRYKMEALTRIIDLHNVKLGIIFCNTKRMVDDLVDHLNTQGYEADRLHGDMTQALRDRVMNRFRKSGLEFLVATDIAARGIDVDDIEVVFNYDLPYDVEDYVHRIGRTGRAGRSGRAISFASGREVFMMQQLERFTKSRIRREQVPSLKEIGERKASMFVDQIREILREGRHEQHDYLVKMLLDEGHSSTDIAAAMLQHFMGDEALVTTDGKKPSPATPRVTSSLPSPSIAVRTIDSSAGTDAIANLPTPSQVPSKSLPSPQETVSPGPRVVVAKKTTETPKPVEPRISPQPARDSFPAKSPQAPIDRKPAFERALRPDRPKLSAPEVVTVRPTSKDRSSTPTPTTKSPGAIRAKISEREGEFLDNQGRPLSKKAKAESDEPLVPMVRLFMNVGSEMGVEPQHVVDTIQGETGLPRSVVGLVDVRERHCFFDVKEEFSAGIISKLKRTVVQGRAVKVKLA